MRAALIVNPQSTRVTPERVERIVAVLGPGLEVLETTRRGEATEFARALGDSVERLYVFGGDGTFNEVLNGVDGRIPLGFIPGGGTSVLPRALGLGRDPVAAARRLAVGTERRIGLGRANGRRFAFAAGLGFDAEVVRRVDALGRRADGRRPGDLTFARETALTLAEHHLRLEPQVELVGLGRAAFVFVANCSPYTYAGPVGLRFAPDASFDGGLDVFAPERVPPRSLPWFVWWGLGNGSKHVRAHDLDRLELRADRPLPFQMDGEALGDLDALTCESEPNAVTVLV
ncbi:MAG: hypothetical protein EXQ77_03615 [Thermoleophilia bacterium]|nr:hypothetical protein [Thermoleophilia bacterium]